MTDREQLIAAYGGGDLGARLADAELQFQQATCAHIACDVKPYANEGCLASGIPLCREHSHLVPGLIDLSSLEAERDMLRRELEAMTELHDAKHRDWRRADDIVDKVRWYLSCRESQHDDCRAANMCHAAGECLRLLELENTDI